MWYPQAVVKAAWGYFFARLQKMPREPSRLPGQQEECMKQLFNFVDCYYLFSFTISLSASFPFPSFDAAFSVMIIFL